VDEPKTTKNDVNTKLDYRILVLIAAGAISLQIALNMGLDDPDKFDMIDIVYLLGSLSCAISAFLISRHYSDSAIFAKAYFCLGLGFSFWFIGDIVWMYTKHILHIEPYPSLADFFYLILYFPMIAHLVINTRYFKRKWDFKTKIWLIILPVIIVGIYSYLLYQGNATQDIVFYYSLTIVATSAITLALAIFGASVFRLSILGTVWLLLAIGLSLVTFADVWYFYANIFEVTEINHPTTTLYMLSNMVVVYALYKHQRIF
jgi:hypothetical protein